MANPFSQDDMKKIGIGAAIGAVVAIPVPFIGPIMGALVGGGIMAFRKYNARR